MATDTPTCSSCGKELPADAPAGLCPACLMKGGLQESRGATRTAPQADSSAPAPPADPVPPEVLAEQFPQLEILEVLGRGGMGVVYKARQPQLDRLVALKILAPDVGDDPAFAERFGREAKAMAKLSHPHIVTVHDFGQTAAGLFFLVMEHVDGTDLRQVMRSGALAPAQALAIVPQVCDALQFAHDAGLVHRDIKPENILLTKAGQVKIADFGLAKLLGKDPADPTLTGDRQVMGTVHYMAPEQMEHPLQVDHRADVYSLGVVFYEMLTGELPLGRFPEPSRKVHIDVRLDDVVLKALEKEPDRRYQHASEVGTDVDQIARTASVPTPPGPPASPPSSRPAAAGGSPKPRPVSRAATVLGWLALAFALLGLVWPVAALLAARVIAAASGSTFGLALAVVVLPSLLFELLAFGLGVAGWRCPGGKAAVIIAVLVFLLSVAIAPLGLFITYRSALLTPRRRPPDVQITEPAPAPVPERRVPVP